MKKDGKYLCQEFIVSKWKAKIVDDICSLKKKAVLQYSLSVEYLSIKAVYLDC